MSYEIAELEPDEAYLYEPQLFDDEEKIMTYEIGDLYEIGYGNPYSYSLGALPYAQYRIGADAVTVPAATAPLAFAQGTLPAPPPMARGPMVVKKKDPNEARLQPFGMNSTLAAPGVAAGATDGTPIVQPQEIVKPRRWVVSDSIAADFMILSLVIGVKPQTPANAPISAEAFRHNTQFADLDFDTCQISQQIAALVQNVGAAPRLFRSTFYAYVAK